MTAAGNHDPRFLLRAMFAAAVEAAHPRHCLPKHLPAPGPRGRIIVVGAGKAAAAMVVAAEQHYRAAGLAARLGGGVVTRHGFALATSILAIAEAGHPVPDQNGVDAATDALQRVAAAGPDDIVLCLLSGGASALWSAPVAGVSLAAKQDLTKQLLRAGARISEINCVRKHLSAIKGGRLAKACRGGRLVTLAISDVPADDPATIGSGPTVADPSTLTDARAVLERFAIQPRPEIMAALADKANETLKPGDPDLARSGYELVATPHASLEAAAWLASRAGYAVNLLGDSLEGEAREVAAEHAQLALAAHRRGQRVAILSGGELTVTVRGNGAGGPNQEYALALALALGGAPGITALAADTDGIDGGAGEADDPAGAIIGPDTMARSRGLDRTAATFLADNDSSGFFTAIGDLVQCGPTQTNVNDFRAILIDP